MLHRHIFASSTFCHCTSPSIECSHSPQQVLSEDIVKGKLPAKHTSVHSFSVFDHIVETSDGTAYTSEYRGGSY